MRVRSGTTPRVSTARPLFAGFGISRTPTESEPLPVPPPTTPNPTAVLAPDRYLAPGQFLISRGGTSRLIHQIDGNVVIYTNGSPVWSTNTAGNTTHFLSMEAGTGNLVLYRDDGVSFWNSGTSGNPGAYAQLLDAGELRIVAPNGTTLFTTKPAPPAPPPPTPPGGVIGDVLERSKRIVNEMMVVLATKVGPIPLFPRGSVYDWVNEVVAWTKRAHEVAQTDPEVARAWESIVALQPPDSRGGLFGAIDWVKEKVQGAIHAVGAAVKFVAGDLPSPDDYDPENLIITAYTDPIKFGLLTAVATIIFPPAVFYMAAYAPPNPVGLTAALAESFARGGGQRVVDKILEPLADHFGKMLNTAIDFAINRDAALVRWALRKIAARLDDGVPKGIILALADAGNAVVEAIKNIAELKSEGFYVDVGSAISKVADQFVGPLKEALTLAGNAIKAGGRAVAILVDKKLAGLKEAMDAFLEGILGIPQGFEALPRVAQVEIARAKVTGIAMVSAITQNLKQGIDDFAAAAQHLPSGIRDLVGSVTGLVAKFAEDVVGFLDNLMSLAQVEVPVPGDEAPAPTTPDTGTPGSGPTPASGGGMSKLLAIGAGGLVGALLGGPIGAVAGAAGGAVLTKG